MCAKLEGLKRERHPVAIIAIYSVKGGVGKTTLAANLAWNSTTASNHETLLWDLDASGGAGFLLGVQPDVDKQAERLFSRNRSARDLIQPTKHDHLHVLPADESLRDVDRHFSRVVRRDGFSRITTWLEKDYSRIILDCPPVLNSLSKHIMRSADLVIVPLPPSPLSTRAFQLVAKEVKSVGAKHPPMLPVLSMVDMRRKLHQKSRQDAPDWPAIPFASAAEQCAVRQAPVGDFAPSSAAARSFTGLWSAIESKLTELGK